MRTDETLPVPLQAAHCAILAPINTFPVAAHCAQSTCGGSVAFTDTFGECDRCGVSGGGGAFGEPASEEVPPASEPATLDALLSDFFLPPPNICFALFATFPAAFFMVKSRKLYVIALLIMSLCQICTIPNVKLLDDAIEPHTT